MFVCVTATATEVMTPDLQCVQYEGHLPYSQHVVCV